VDGWVDFVFFWAGETQKMMQYRYPLPIKTHPDGDRIIAIVNGLTLKTVVEEPSTHQALQRGE